MSDTVHFVRPSYRDGGRAVPRRPGTIVGAVCGRSAAYPHEATVLPADVTCPACQAKLPHQDTDTLRQTRDVV